MLVFRKVNLFLFWWRGLGVKAAKVGRTRSFEAVSCRGFEVEVLRSV